MQYHFRLISDNFNCYTSKTQSEQKQDQVLKLLVITLIRGCFELGQVRPVEPHKHEVKATQRFVPDVSRSRIRSKFITTGD